MVEDAAWGADSDVDPLPQVRELLTNYGPIGLIWFDTPKRMTSEQSRGLVDLVHQLQPECLVNGRIGNGLGDYAESRDNVIPTGSLQSDWEVPATINDTWGFKTSDHNWKSPADLVRKDKRFTELGLRAEDYATRDAVIALLLTHPELMQRPIVFRGSRAIIARPTDTVLDLLT